MDILAARKKAAEQASTRNKPEPVAAAAETRPRQEPEAPPAPAESGTGGIVGSPRPGVADVAPVIEEARDQAGIVPVSSAGEPEGTQQGEIELLSFRLGGEEYAVPVANVREVLKLIPLTIVPNTPDYILGVTSLRGTVLPIIDLCKRFGITPAVHDDEKTRIVVVNSNEEDVGLKVDRVTGVLKIMPDDIKPTPENIEHGAEYLRGIVRKEDKLYIVLDLEKALGK